MSDIFNVDKLVGEKTVVVAGKSYTVQPVAVRFWAKIVLLDKKEREGKLTPTDMFDTYLEVIKNALPDIDVQKLPIQAVEPLFQFIVNTAKEEKKTGK